MTVSTERSIEPRCTGMCGALATSVPSCVEHRAGEVEPLLDVDRVGGVLQRHAHLLGDRHEQVVEHLQHHRIGLGADGVRALAAPRRASARDGSSRVSRGLPAGLDHDGLVRLDDDGRACDLVAGRKLIARCRRRRCARCRRRRTCVRARRARAAWRAWPCAVVSVNFAPPPTASTDTASTTSCFVAVDEAEARLVRLLEGATVIVGERAGRRRPARVSVPA